MERTRAPRINVDEQMIHLRTQPIQIDAQNCLDAAVVIVGVAPQQCRQRAPRLEHDVVQRRNAVARRGELGGKLERQHMIAGVHRSNFATSRKRQRRRFALDASRKRFYCETAAVGVIVVAVVVDAHDARGAIARVRRRCNCGRARR